jgi:hypothetical protein
MLDLKIYNVRGEVSMTHCLKACPGFFNLYPEELSLNKGITAQEAEMKITMPRAESCVVRNRRVACRGTHTHTSYLMS